jgi:hypothetical protein
MIILKTYDGAIDISAPTLHRELSLPVAHFHAQRSSHLFRHLAASSLEVILIRYFILKLQATR